MATNSALVLKALIDNATASGGSNMDGSQLQQLMQVLGHPGAAALFAGAPLVQQGPLLSAPANTLPMPVPKVEVPGSSGRPAAVDSSGQPLTAELMLQALLQKHQQLQRPQVDQSQVLNKAAAMQLAALITAAQPQQISG